MKFETKFGIGDEVVCISLRQRETRVTCKACSGDGTITLGDGESYPCPKCQGEGFTTTVEPTGWCRLYCSRVIEVKASVWVAQGELKSRTVYSLGSVSATWSEDQVWTEDTYQAECNRRNALL